MPSVKRSDTHSTLQLSNLLIMCLYVLHCGVLLLDESQQNLFETFQINPALFYPWFCFFGSQLRSSFAYIQVSFIEASNIESCFFSRRIMLIPEDSSIYHLISGLQADHSIADQVLVGLVTISLVDVVFGRWFLLEVRKSNSIRPICSRLG